MFVNDRFYIAGENDEHPTIYILDRDGALIDTFAQPVDGEDSMLDLAWDGEFLWGSVGRMIYRFDIEGELDRSFEGAFDRITSLAWDTERALLWTAGTNSDIVGLNIDGDIQSEFDRQELRIYGLSYWSEDSDGFNLYITQYDRDENNQPISKMNTETGEIQSEFVLAPELVGRPGGAFITNGYDVHSWTLIMVNTFTPVGGDDRIDIWQLDFRRDWFELSPLEGEIAAGDSMVFQLQFNAEGIPPDEVFEGQLVFDHNGLGSQSLIDVELTIIENFNSVNRSSKLLIPTGIALETPYPNPFNSVTRLNYGLPQAGIVNISIYDITGHMVENLINGIQVAGHHSVSWDAKTLSSGLYFAEMRAQGYNSVQKIVLTK